MREAAAALSNDRVRVLSMALSRIAESWQLTNEQLGAILGLSPATASRLRGGSFAMEPQSKAFELGQHLLRLFRGLDALMGAQVPPRPGIDVDHITIGEAEVSQVVQATETCLQVKYSSADCRLTGLYQSAFVQASDEISNASSPGRATSEAASRNSPSGRKSARRCWGGGAGVQVLPECVSRGLEQLQAAADAALQKDGTGLDRLRYFLKGYADVNMADLAAA